MSISDGPYDPSARCAGTSPASLGRKAFHFFVIPHSTANPVFGTMPSILSAR
jgi:hypothetical protein